MGAIDDKPSTDQADLATAKNYVDAALKELAAGQKVSTPATRAYGCNVKYAGWKRAAASIACVILAYSPPHLRMAAQHFNS